MPLKEELYISDFRLITKELTILTGYPFDQLQPITLKRSLLKIINSCYIEKVEDFCKRLHDKDFLNSVLRKLIVPGTEFFRDSSVWSLLKNELTFLSTQKQPRFLVMGVANGTELYSIFIVLRELGLFEKAKIDVSSVLNENKREIRNLCFDHKMMEVSINNYTKYNEKGDLLSYFVKNEDLWCYRSDLIEKVTNYYSLSELNTKAEGYYDVVWARNQMIYQKGKSKSDLFKLIDKLTKDEGIMAIGVKEKIPFLYESYYEELAESEKVFKKVKKK